MASQLDRLLHQTRSRAQRDDARPFRPVCHQSACSASDATSSNDNAGSIRDRAARTRAAESGEPVVHHNQSRFDLYYSTAFSSAVYQHHDHSAGRCNRRHTTFHQSRARREEPACNRG